MLGEEDVRQIVRQELVPALRRELRAESKRLFTGVIDRVKSVKVQFYQVGAAAPSEDQPEAESTEEETSETNELLTV